MNQFDQQAAAGATEVVNISAPRDGGSRRYVRYIAAQELLVDRK